MGYPARRVAIPLEWRFLLRGAREGRDLELGVAKLTSWRSRPFLHRLEAGAADIAILTEAQLDVARSAFPHVVDAGPHPRSGQPSGSKVIHPGSGGGSGVRFPGRFTGTSPRRRLYEVTGAGQKALAAWRLEEGAAIRLRPRPAGSDPM
jgi:hypothetical protein